MLRGFEHLSSERCRDGREICSDKREKKAREDHTNVYEYLKGLSKEEQYTLFSGAQ